MSESSLPRRQIMLFAGIAAVIAVTLLALYFMLLGPQNEVLFDGLRPADASAIVAELDKHKLPYSLADKGTTILVPEKMADSARLAIAGSELPMKGEVGFELFNKSDMGLTEFAQKINYQRALQGELARTITTLNGIDSARVHLSLPEQSIFEREHGQAKASVTITTRPGIRLDDSQVAGIQRLVASAVPNLDTGAVVVLNGEGDVVSSAAPAEVDPVQQQRQAVAQYYAGRVREALQALGRDDQVSVFALSSLAVPTAAGSPDADSGTGSGGELSTSPRRFGLRVVIEPRTALDRQAEQEIVRAARRAIDFDPGKGDEVSTGAILHQGPMPSIPVTAQRTVAIEGSSGRGVSPAVTSYGLVITILSLVVALSAIIIWYMSRRPISQRRRERLTAQLADLLDRHQGSQPDAV